MSIEKRNPDLYSVLGRRRKTVAEFLEDQDIYSTESLNQWLKGAYGSWQISQTFLDEANDAIASESSVAISKEDVVEEKIEMPIEKIEEDTAPTPAPKTKRTKQLDS